MCTSTFAKRAAAPRGRRRARAAVRRDPDRPHDADRRSDAVELADVIEQLRAVARQAGIVAQPLRPEDRVGAAVAGSHRRGAAVELRQRADVRQRVLHVGLAGRDLRQPRLAALPRARILVGAEGRAPSARTGRWRRRCSRARRTRRRCRAGPCRRREWRRPAPRREFRLADGGRAR